MRTGKSDTVNDRDKRKRMARRLAQMSDEEYAARKEQSREELRRQLEEMNEQREQNWKGGLVAR